MKILIKRLLIIIFFAFSTHSYSIPILNSLKRITQHFRKHKEKTEPKTPSLCESEENLYSQFSQYSDNIDYQWEDFTITSAGAFINFRKSNIIKPQAKSHFYYFKIHLSVNLNQIEQAINVFLQLLMTNPEISLLYFKIINLEKINQHLIDWNWDNEGTPERAKQHRYSEQEVRTNYQETLRILHGAQITIYFLQNQTSAEYSLENQIKFSGVFLKKLESAFIEHQIETGVIPESDALLSLKKSKKTESSYFSVRRELSHSNETIDRSIQTKPNSDNELKIFMSNLAE